MDGKRKPMLKYTVMLYREDEEINPRPIKDFEPVQFVAQIYCKQHLFTGEKKIPIYVWNETPLHEVMEMLVSKYPQNPESNGE